VIRLEQLRLDARMTPEDLGTKSGVAPNTIRRIESGRGAHVATLGKLADALEVNPSELLQEVQPLEPAA